MEYAGNFIHTVIHKYKYTHDRRRRILRKMCKQGLIVFKGIHDSALYYLMTSESLVEYGDRVNRNKEK
jgi:metallophosphoesterase superfamily enzyme